MNRHYKFWIYNYLSIVFPFNWFKVPLLRWCGVTFKGKAHIGYNVRFSGNGIVSVGDGAYFTGNSHINVNGVFMCGDGVMLSEGVSISVGQEGSLRLSNEVKLGQGVICSGSGHIEFGERSECWHRSLIMANGKSKVIVGSDCKIAHFVSLKTTTHVIDPRGPCIGGDVIFKDIVIGDGSWLCAGSVVLPGVIVSKKTLVAAGAVVIRDTSPSSLVAGVPAKEIKRYTI